MIKKTFLFQQIGLNGIERLLLIPYSLWFADLRVIHLSQIRAVV